MPKSLDDYANEMERNPRGFLLKLAGVIVVIAVIFAVIGWVSNWFGTAADVASPKNVKDQYSHVIQDWESLKVAADNACAVGSAPKEENDPVFVENPAAAYGATYRRIVVDYNSRQKNIFEAGVVGPPGYPREIPDYPESQGATPDWCSVSTKLTQLHAG